MDDTELIDRLGTFASEPPPLRYAGDSALLAARRAQRRRRVTRLAAVGTGVAGAAAAVALGVATPAEAKAAAEVEDRKAAERGQATVPSAAAAMAKALGADFAVQDGRVVLRPGSPAAGRLPRDYEAWTQAIAGPGLSTSDDLASFCRALEEKGMVREACTDQQLADGTTVHAQWSSWAPTPKDVQPNMGQGLRVIYIQADGDWVILDLSAGQSAGTATDATQAAAGAWLADLAPRMIAAASAADV